MEVYTALVTTAATDDPETEWFFYSAGYELAKGSLEDCLVAAMSFGNNANPHESAEIKASNGAVVWRHRRNGLVPSQFRNLPIQEIEAAIAAATTKGWDKVGKWRE